LALISGARPLKYEKENYNSVVKIKESPCNGIKVYLKYGIYSLLLNHNTKTSYD
jgi:hypothetical protein